MLIWFILTAIFICCLALIVMDAESASGHKKPPDPPEPAKNDPWDWLMTGEKEEQ